MPVGDPLPTAAVCPPHLGDFLQGRGESGDIVDLGCVVRQHNLQQLGRPASSAAVNSTLPASRVRCHLNVTATGVSC